MGFARMAWRNLWRQKRRTWLTAVAIIFSNTLLVFMISLQFGTYEMMISNTLQSFSGHLQVQHVGYRDNARMRDSIPGAIALAQRLRAALPGARVTTRGEAFALVSSDERSFGIQVVGVEPATEGGVSTLPGLVSEGRFLDDPRAAEIVIGATMARNLKVGLGDELTLLGSGRDGSFAAGVVTVVGLFDSGQAELDRSIAEVPLPYFQDTFFMDGQAHVIALAVPDLADVAPTASTVQSLLPTGASLVTLDWNALQPGLKQAIQADLSSAWFMYGVLILLVAFSVLNTQLMSVLERTREFGVIMALGVTPRNLAGLIFLETGLMAAIGLLIGLALGTGVAAWFREVGFAYPGMEEMGARFNLPGRMYPELTPLSLLLGPSVVYLFCLAAAIYPALRLFRLHPVAAMRAA